MDPELYKLIQQAVREGLASTTWLLILSWLVAAGVGSFVGSYFKKKGENLATKEDFQQVLDQLTKQTEATEKIKGSIAIAIEERRAWSRKNMTGQLFDRFKTYRLVELTIMYHPNKTDVGGPVDEIELDPSGVRWLHRKSNCPEIYQ